MGIWRLKHHRREVAGFIPAALWAALVVFLSLSPARIVGGLRWFSVPHSDKLFHGVFYLIFAGFVLYGFCGLRNPHRWYVLWTFLICTAFGALMEVLQGLAGHGRHFEPGDILANTIGVLIACIIFILLIKRNCHGS